MHRLKTNIRRKIKLIRTAPALEKMRWAGFVVILTYILIWYLKGVS